MGQIYFSSLFLFPLCSLVQISQIYWRKKETGRGREPSLLALVAIWNSVIGQRRKIRKSPFKRNEVGANKRGEGEASFSVTLVLN